MQLYISLCWSGEQRALILRCQKLHCVKYRTELSASLLAQLSYLSDFPSLAFLFRSRLGEHGTARVAVNEPSFLDARNCQLQWDSSVENNELHQKERQCCHTQKAQSVQPTLLHAQIWIQDVWTRFFYLEMAWVRIFVLIHNLSMFFCEKCCFGETFTMLGKT